jgi:hypothetical protein
MHLGEAKVLVLNPLWITGHQRQIVINFHQDFIASLQSKFFQG